MVMNSRLMVFARWVWFTGVIVAVLTTAEAAAADIKALDITQNGRKYSVTFDATVDAPAHSVYNILVDYARLDELSPVIIAISVYASPDGMGERVRSVLKSCIGPFCRNITQVEDVTESNGDTITATMVPALSDFSSGHCVWRIFEDGSHTRLHYEATRTVAFWMPPLIGSILIKRMMYEHLTASVSTLEKVIKQGRAALKN